MKKFYQQLFLFFPCMLLSFVCRSQSCDSLAATYVTYESRCAATGSIKINASGGSGNYKYKMTGASNSNYTTTDSITGLSAGTYILTVTDVASNCVINISGVVVTGNYQDPRFTLSKEDVSCDNGNNGSITVNGQLYGLAPFTYSIVAPSPMGIGSSNNTGIFTDLVAGNYSIRLTDSCGGIQTRQITVGNYTWWIDSYSFNKITCDEATGYIKVLDSRGNISTVGGIPGFAYGIVRSPGDTTWSTDATFTFTMAGQQTFDIVVKDNCGLIKKATVTLVMAPSSAATVNVYDKLCNSFSASLEVTNFSLPEFCLYDSAGVLITCNYTGIFTGLAYANYCIKAHDACTDTTITRCFTATPPPISVGNEVAITNKTCNTFTATITGQSGLTNPDYCLYDSTDALISCNTTGIFTDILYGYYCIKTKDNCRDTTITRCFNVQPPTPIFPDVVVPAYVTCTSFGIIVAGDSVTLPLYCLYDTAGIVIACNNNGIFDSIPLGNYCVTMHDDCTDTTITRCFSILAPLATNDMTTSVTDRTCNTFSITVRSNSFVDPLYCLYNGSGTLLGCNTSGIFTALPYGDYCIKATLICPDTVLTTCFSVAPTIPTLSFNVSTHHGNCTSFSASATSVAGFTNPEFCLFNNLNNLIACNNTGEFGPIPYGQYAVKVTDGCYDTTVIKYFTKLAPVVSLSGSGSRSCTLGFAKFSLSMGGGNLPVEIKVYKPDGSLLLDTITNSNNINIDNIPGLPVGSSYQVIATDNCGNKDTLLLSAPPGYFNHTPVVVPKCPGSSWANGSGDIAIAVNTNLGALTVRIVQKDGVAYSPALVPNSVAAGIFTFTDLGPGTYIISSNENSCNKKFNDTITITPYQFPNLSRSSAYQCDINGFSVSAVAFGGVPPFSYEIIGSIPSFPSIISGPQTSPVFNINNGTTYSLIRLRALDACGNATLGDASILPLAMNGIVVSANCFSLPTTLSVDPIYNATYSWYKKSTAASTDSIFLGSGVSYYIPEVTLAETGLYICYVSVNDGCITRAFNYTLTGLCFIVLPVKIETFEGQKMNGYNALSWKISQEEMVERYILEKKNTAGNFTAINSVAKSSVPAKIHHYSAKDMQPGIKEYYRLKIVNKDGTVNYSNIVLISNDQPSNYFSIYPNPVKDVINIIFKVTGKQRYKINLLNGMGQRIKSVDHTVDGAGKLTIPRPAFLQKGMYIIQLTNMESGAVFKEKLIFL